MAQESVFGLHTAEFKRWISLKEANSIKAFFNLNPDEELTGNTYFYQDGITKLWIEEVKGKKPRYYLHLIVNFARALRVSNYKALPYTTGNVRKVFTAINKVLKALPLSDGNAVFPDWTTERFDSDFDVCEEHTALLMQLLNYSLDLSDRKKRCKRIPIQGKTAQESECQSMRFGNNSFTYNVYRKIEEILDKGKSITEEEKAEAQYLLRIERQNHQDAVKKLLPNMKASDLASEKVRADVLRVMVDEMGLFFGKGDYYAWKGIKRTYLPDHEADIRAILDTMKRITNNSLEREVCPKEAAAIFDRLKISPVGIKKDAVKQYGVDWMQGVYNRITAEYPRPPDKRQYSSFPIPHQTKNDGRIGANITFYSINDGKKTITVRGKSLGDYEEKVFDRLRRTYLVNRQYLKSDDKDKRDMLLKSADSIKRFHKAARTAAARQDAESLIESSILYDERKLLDPGNSS